MRVFLTGATGFIGGHVARLLRERGDEVVCLVRDREKATPLAALGCDLVEGDLSDEAKIRAGLEGCDAAVHGAAIYEVGIPKGARRAMYDANVLGTERVLRAALAAKTGKVVYISTVAAFGNTRGQVVDEGYEHPAAEFTSCYEETKYRAHQVAKRMAREEGLPLVMVQPGGVYGPEDHSELGNTMNQFLKGRLPVLPFPDLGFNLVHVEDVAAGVLLALDKGAVGESYVLGGEITTMRGMIGTLAKVSGRRAPTKVMPTAVIKASAPFGRVIGPLLGFPPNMRELISSSDGVTFWAKDDKARADLGYSPRGLEQGLRDMLEAEGRLPAAA